MHSFWSAVLAVLLGCLVALAGTPAWGQFAASQTSTTAFRPPAASAAPPVPLDLEPAPTDEHPLELALEFAQPFAVRP